MTNLWVFGDSYTSHSERNQDFFWTYQVAKKLSCTNYINASQYGVSNEYISDRFLSFSNQIKKDDYIIIIVTSKDRHWFFEKFPYLSNYNPGNKKLIEQAIDKNSAKAIDYFYKKLYFEKSIDIKIQWYYRWLESLEKIYKNLLIIPGFNNGIHVDNNFEVHGNLFSIGNSEWKNTKEIDYVFSKWNNTDMRAGHMTKKNHNILTNKIVNTFRSAVPLNLNNGFYTDIIDSKNYKTFETLDKDHILF